VKSVNLIRCYSFVHPSTYSNLTEQAMSACYHLIFRT